MLCIKGNEIVSAILHIIIFVLNGAANFNRPESMRHVNETQLYCKNMENIGKLCFAT